MYAGEPPPLKSKVAWIKMRIKQMNLKKKTWKLKKRPSINLDAIHLIIAVVKAFSFLMQIIQCLVISTKFDLNFLFCFFRFDRYWLPIGIIGDSEIRLDDEFRRCQSGGEINFHNILRPLCSITILFSFSTLFVHNFVLCTKKQVILLNYYYT